MNDLDELIKRARGLAAHSYGGVSRTLRELTDVLEAATEGRLTQAELEDIAEAHAFCADRLLIETELVDEIRAERDAALAAVSDARAVCLHLGGIDGDVSPPAPSYYVSVGRNVVATEVLAALDGKEKNE